MEPVLGTNLGNVRLVGGQAGRSIADTHGADAVTTGHTIAIKPELANFDRPKSQFALAHELTHVVQNDRSRTSDLSGVEGGNSSVRSSLETEADHVGARVSGIKIKPHSAPPNPKGGGAASHSGPPVQRGFFEWVEETAGDIYDVGASAVSAVGRGVSRAAGAVYSAGASAVSAIGDVAGAAYELGASAVSSVGSALTSAWDAATTFLGDAAGWAWEGIKSLGSSAWNWLSRAGSAVWDAIKWLGGKAWEGIKWLGGFLWEKLAHLGRMAWSFISNIPVRLWRIVVHLWDGITGLLGWMWRGLKGIAGAAWDAVVGVFSWLGSGIWGALQWLGDGIARGASWAWDFVKDPSLDKLYEALLGGLSWVWEGISGFGRWGWRGIVGAAKWAWEGIKGFAGWLWDGLKGGAEWAGRLLIYLFELLGLGELLQLLWGLIFRMRPLTAAEIAASQQVHPAGLIPYGAVRVDDNSILTWINGGRAVTTWHVLHYPKGGLDMDVVVHELTHVAQYEKVGAVYMAEALHAQEFGAGYNYGNLTTLRAAGQRFADFNREQQARICGDYYLALNGLATKSGGTLTELQPFIDDMRRGEF